MFVTISDFPDAVIQTTTTFGVMLACAARVTPTLFMVPFVESHTTTFTDSFRLFATG